MSQTTSNGLVKVIGRIELPEPPKRLDPPYICDDCGATLDGSYGDPRVVITRLDLEGDSVRHVCNVCADELFGDHEPKSIFE